MKRTKTKTALALTAALALACAPAAFAAPGHHYRGGYHGHHGWSGGYHRHYHRDNTGRWIAGAIVAGALFGVVANATAPDTYYYEQPPVVYQAPPPAVVYRQAPPVVYESAPRVVYRQAPPVAYEPAPRVVYQQAPIDQHVYQTGTVFSGPPDTHQTRYLGNDGSWHGN